MACKISLHRWSLHHTNSFVCFQEADFRELDLPATTDGSKISLEIYQVDMIGSDSKFIYTIRIFDTLELQINTPKNKQQLQEKERRRTNQTRIQQIETHHHQPSNPQIGIQDDQFQHTGLDTSTPPR